VGLKLLPLGVVMLQNATGAVAGSPSRSVSGQALLGVPGKKMKRPFGVPELAKVRPVPGIGKLDCSRSLEYTTS
jgi:hypothetical protein